jgi:LysR family transcriptional regulator, regulator for bpeEF and oprC
LDIELTRLFVKVVQHGGFSRAAEALRLPKSTISKAVARLESETGTKLLLRTTRNQTLTAAGRVFYETCLGPLQTLEDAQKSLYGHDNIVAGKIKLTAPEDIGAYIIAPAIARLCKKYPKLEFELDYTNEVIDLIKDGYDLAVRLGPLKESSLKARKVGELQLIPVASREYLHSSEKIETPKDLENHVCLAIASEQLVNEWLLRSERKVAKIKIHSQVHCNQVTSLIRIAKEGVGVALIPKFICKQELASKELIQVLPEWSGQRIDVSLVSPVSTSTSSRLALVSEEIGSALKEAFSPML